MRPLKDRDAAVLAWLKRDKSTSPSSLRKIISTLSKTAQRIARDMPELKDRLTPKNK